MELHEQQQQHLQPDVVPTPFAVRPSRLDDESGELAVNDTTTDEDEIEVVRNAVTLSPENEDVVNQQATADITVGSPSLPGAVVADANQPVCAPSYNFGQYPITMTCPCCDYTILTYVQYDISMKQYMICFLLCLCFLWPCSLIPCLFRGMYDVYHFCPVCRRLIGVYKA